MDSGEKESYRDGSLRIWVTSVHAQTRAFYSFLGRVTGYSIIQGIKCIFGFKIYAVVVGPETFKDTINIVKYPSVQTKMDKLMKDNSAFVSFLNESLWE